MRESNVGEGVSVGECRSLAALLLVVQCGLELLAALGLLGYARLSGAVAYLAPAEVVAFAGPVVLLLLAAGVVRGWRGASWGVYAWESVTLAGSAFSVVASAGAALNLTSAITGLALPVATILLVRITSADLRKGLIVGLLLLTGLIHLALAPEHLAQPPRLGLLFIIDGLGFVGLAAAALRSSRAGPRWWRPAAISLLLATIAAYVVAVLRRQEAVDDLGIATKLVELLALGLIIWPREARRGVHWLAAASAVLAAIVVSGGLAWAAALRQANSPGHVHAGAAQVIAAAPPTDAQRAAAQQLIDDTRAGIAAYADVSMALADGYRPSTPPRAPTVHYTNQALVRDGHLLDPAHPQALVYANTPAGPLLLGAMYMLPKANVAPPNFGGSLAEWHTHPNLCFGVGLVGFGLPPRTIDGLESPFGTCPVGSINAPTPAMLHVWTVANPAGPFADLSPAFVGRLTRGSGT